ncbi:MAG TPA: ATP synthase F0 subunit B [Candidatus Xenobia bacterium]|nr:ATP synthase F0 subunit B [Candidatus Xenobia bacterium]
MDILSQLGDLFLGAAPTVVIVFLLFLFLRWSFWRPLERALAERHATTEGARQQAEKLLNVANEKLRQYEDALRQARTEIYQQQEASRRAALEERNHLVREARERAQASVRQSKLEIAAEVDQAKKALEGESQRLAEEISRTLLAAGERRE